MKCCQGKSYFVHLGKRLGSNSAWTLQIKFQIQIETSRFFFFFYIFVFLDVFFTNQANYDTREGSKLCIIINLITKYNVVPSEHKQTNVVPARASSSIAIIRLWDKSKMESWTSDPDSWGSETRDGSDGYRPKPVHQTSINLN